MIFEKSRGEDVSSPPHTLAVQSDAIFYVEGLELRHQKAILGVHLHTEYESWLTQLEEQGLEH